MAVVSIERPESPEVAMPVASRGVPRFDRSMTSRLHHREISADSTDAELFVGIGERHEAALAEVYRRHGAAVFGLCTRVLGNQAMAEDVTQELFLRLWNEPHRFDPQRGALRSFLQREAHSRSIERVRSEDARRRREERSHRELVEDPPTVEVEVEARVESQQLRNALSSLAPNERRAIELAYFGGLSYRDVALELGQPEGTVKSRIRAGLRTLAAMIDSNELDSNEKEAER